MVRKIFSLLCALVAAAQLSAASKDCWTVSASSRDNYKGVALANGQIGIVPDEHFLGIRHIIVGGVYDSGDGFDAVSTTLFAPKFLSASLAIDGERLTDDDVTSWRQTLDMRRAALTTDCDTKKARISYTVMALRNMPFVGLMAIEVTPREDIELDASSRIELYGRLGQAEYGYNVYHDGAETMPLYTMACKSGDRATDIAATSCFVFDDKQIINSERSAFDDSGVRTIGFSRKLAAGERFRFYLVGSVCTSRTFSNPRNESRRMVITAICNGARKLIAAHEAEWERLWHSDIEIEGDDETQRDVRLALYNLYSFAGEDTRRSISPMGLSSNGYNGHVFWDTEIWMYPPLLMLNQQMAKSCIDYRFDRLAQARRRAAQFGYHGAMFPWESDDSGEEATPLFALSGPLEQHITADIAIAAWNYYCVTGNREWLRDEGFPLISNAADFIVSRVERNADGTYSFKNVVGADEFAINVDDNAYTNGTAMVALRYAMAAAKALGRKPGRLWQTVAAKIKFHYFADGVMREHAAYDGQMIKQGDVNLLAYPLGIMTNTGEVRKNLDYYEGKIDPHGPAMGNSILAIIYCSLGDKANALRLFKKSYIPHKCPPFGVLSEGAGGGNPYFATGAGGMLQAVLAGFGGLRITPQGIVQGKGLLPEGWTKLTIKGVGPQKKTFTVGR